MAQAQAYKDILSKLNDLSSSDLDGDGKTRREAVALSQKLLNLLMDPKDRATLTIYQPWLNVAIRIAIDLKIFTYLTENTGAHPIEELAKVSQAEPSTLARILWQLGATGFVQETQEGAWTASPITKAMANPATEAGHRFYFDTILQAAMSAPEFVRQRGLALPTDPWDGLMQHRFQTKLNIFEFFDQKMPESRRDFNLFMGATLGDRDTFWGNFYPLRERVLQEYDPARAPVLLVDVAGGKGHDIRTFAGKVSGLVPSGIGEKETRLVLQDLPATIDAIEPGYLPAGVEAKAHDFFTEQPIRGARVYFFHHILHDWSDEYCLKILSHIVPVMTPGYSKLIINDLILPDTGVSPFASTFDLTMMACTGGKERSRKQWTKLLSDAGLEVSGFWSVEPDADGIVEACIPGS